MKRTRGSGSDCGKTEKEKGEERERGRREEGEEGNQQARPKIGIGPFLVHFSEFRDPVEATPGHLACTRDWH